MDRIFLHAGQPKTGTTAIQYFLGESREELERLGYLFPREGLSHIHNHGPLVSDIRGEPSSPQHRGSARRLARTLAESPLPKAVISAERLFPDFGECLAAGGRNMVVEYFAQTGIPTTIISYLRADPARLNSVYIQKIKSFRIDLSLQEFVDDQLGRVEVPYMKFLELAVPSKVDLVFRPFDKSVQGRGVVRDFLLAVGLFERQSGMVGEERRLNDSLGPIALEAARTTLERIKRDAPEPTLRQRRALREALFGLVEGERPEPTFYGMDAALSERVDRTLGEDRESFARAVWGRGWGEVFPPETRPMNAFDPSRAEPDAADRYRRLCDGLWRAAEAIMADDRMAEPRPWERRERRGSASAG
jgi:hypothetical protein